MPLSLSLVTYHLLPMNNRDLEIIAALETLYHEDLSGLDVDVIRATIYGIVDEMETGVSEPLPFEQLSDVGQMALLIKLVKALEPGVIEPTQPAE